MALLKEEERICRELGRVDELAARSWARPSCSPSGCAVPEKLSRSRRKRSDLASRHGLAPVARWVEAFLRDVRRRSSLAP